MTKLKRWRLYDIQYRNGKTGPAEFTLDLDSFEWSKDIPVGPFNLNTKVYKAIKEVSGLEMDTCKVEMVYLPCHTEE